MWVIPWPFVQSHLILICKQNSWNLGIYLWIKWYSAWVKTVIGFQNLWNKAWKYFENLGCESINLNKHFHIILILFEVLKEFIYWFEFTWHVNNWHGCEDYDYWEGCSGNRHFKSQNKNLLKRHGNQLKTEPCIMTICNYLLSLHSSTRNRTKIF